MKLLVDMNLSPRSVDFLTDAGWETVHWSAVGQGNAPHVEVRAYATKHGYLLLTDDLDFGAMLAATHDSRNPSPYAFRKLLKLNPELALGRGYCPFSFPVNLFKSKQRNTAGVAVLLYLWSTFTRTFFLR